MKPRQWIESHRAAALGGAFGVLALSAAVLIATLNRNGDGPQVRQSYFLDLKTGRQFVAAADQLPPIVAPGATETEPTGVLAHVFSCGKCSAEDSQFVGYVEMASPEMRKTSPAGKRRPDLARGRPGSPSANAVVGGFLMAVAPDPQAKVEWEPRTVAREDEARKAASAQCPPGGTAVECYPR